VSRTEDHVHLLISAGRGPAECAWAVAQLLRRLEADATRQHLATHRVHTVLGDRPDTYRSVLLQISGAGAEEFTGSWTGTLCWQAPSPYRASTGRKNWYVIAQSCQVDAPRTSFAEEDIDIVACRTGGPGGQHRNKTSTAARATHRPSGIVVVVDTERQFSQNRRLALQRLRQRIEHDDRVTDRAVTKASWRIHDKLVRGNPTRIERPDTQPGSDPPAPKVSQVEGARPALRHNIGHGGAAVVARYEGSADDGPPSVVELAARADRLDAGYDLAAGVSARRLSGLPHLEWRPGGTLLVRETIRGGVDIGDT
jgi:peptide chain release factor